MKANEFTAKEVYEAVVTRCGTDDSEKVIDFLIEELLRQARDLNSLYEQDAELEGLFDTVVACLVEQMGGEARINMACIEDPPDLWKDDDAVTGEWIYITSPRGKTT